MEEDRGDEKLRVRMLRIIEHPVGEASFYHLSLLHNHETLGVGDGLSALKRLDQRGNAGSSENESGLAAARPYKGLEFAGVALRPTLGNLER
jgi:hypothetical protein